MPKNSAGWKVQRRVWAGAWVSFVLLLASCTIISPPSVEPTATIVSDRPPDRPAEVTVTLVLPDPTSTTAAAAPSATATQPTPKPSATRPTPTATRTPIYDFVLQPGSPSYVPNIFRQDLGCGWMGIGGQVFGRDGNPAKEIIVEVSGELDGTQILQLSISGAAPQYGAGGYEITLASRPIASSDALQAVLYDLEGKTLSAPIVFDTLDSCTGNLILINFLANDYYQTRYYLPFTGKQTGP